MARTLGDVIRLARERAGLTQSELGKAAGISAAQISQIETGARRDPQFSTVSRIATVLGVPMDQLAADAGLIPMPHRKTQSLREAEIVRAVHEAERLLGLLESGHDVAKGLRALLNAASLKTRR